MKEGIFMKKTYSMKNQCIVNHPTAPVMIRVWGDDVEIVAEKLRKFLDFQQRDFSGCCQSMSSKMQELRSEHNVFMRML